jgi:hypothetical protein
MCFEMEIEAGAVKNFHPYYFRNDYAGFEQNAFKESTQRIDAAMISSQRSSQEDGAET